MPFPFEVGFDEVRNNLDACVDAVFECLESEFLVMPKGDGFVEFPVFEDGYEALKRATGGFHEVTPDTIVPVVYETPIALTVLRSMLGFTPSEWAYDASQHTGINVTQSAARTIDRSIRMHPHASPCSIVEKRKGDGTAHLGTRRRCLPCSRDRLTRGTARQYPLARQSRYPGWANQRSIVGDIGNSLLNPAL